MPKACWSFEKLWLAAPEEPRLQALLYLHFPCLCNKNQLDALEFHHNPANRQSTKKHNTYQLLYTHSVPPDDGLQICPKHVEVDWRNKLRVNSASSWFLLHRYIEMHGQQNIKCSVSFSKNKHYHPERHELVLLYNRHGFFSLRGRNWTAMHCLYGVRQFALRSLYWHWQFSFGNWHIPNMKSL
jgi:hypothetical protein